MSEQSKNTNKRGYVDRTILRVCDFRLSRIDDRMQLDAVDVNNGDVFGSIEFDPGADVCTGESVPIERFEACELELEAVLDREVDLTVKLAEERGEKDGLKRQLKELNDYLSDVRKSYAATEREQCRVREELQKAKVELRRAQTDLNELRVRRSSSSERLMKIEKLLRS